MDWGGVGLKEEGGGMIIPAFSHAHVLQQHELYWCVYNISPVQWIYLTIVSETITQIEAKSKWQLDKGKYIKLSPHTALWVISVNADIT